MSRIITIRFQRKNITETICNSVLIGLGIVLLYFGIVSKPMLLYLGSIFTLWGTYAFSKSKGVLVDPNQPFIWSYKSFFWIKMKKKCSLKDIESVMVSTGTQVHDGAGGGMFVRTSVSFMVYKLLLLPNPYSKIEKVYLGDFFTKEECMKAAEELSKTTSLPLVIKIRK